MNRFVLALVFGILLIASQPTDAIVDRNSNGVSDLWEMTYNEGALMPSNYNLQADPDKDGWNNAQEAAAGTNPNDANPPMGFVSVEITHIPASYTNVSGTVQLATPETMQLRWHSIAGKKYSLFYSPDLTTWIPVDEQTGDGTMMGNCIPITQPDGSKPPVMLWRVSVSDLDTDNDGASDAEELQSGSSIYLSDTDGDGVNDGAAFSLGLNPSGGGVDENGDGLPDNEIYSVEFEIQNEIKHLKPDMWEPLHGADPSTRYLTSTNDYEFTIADSPRYEDTDEGLLRMRESVLEEGVLTWDGKATLNIEGEMLSEWEDANPITLGSGEILELGATTTTTSEAPPTATETSTTTTWSTPWVVRNGDHEVIRSGTEVIASVDRHTVSDPTTYDGFWNTHFAARAWDAQQPDSQGPPEIPESYLQYVNDLPAAAESIRESYRNSRFNIYCDLNLVGPQYDEGGFFYANRLKKIRWRWVRFNPADPFTRYPADPPKGLRKQFSFIVHRDDTKGVVNPLSFEDPFDPASVGMVTFECASEANSSGWHELSLAPFESFRQESPPALEEMSFERWSNSRVWLGNLPMIIQKRIPQIASDPNEATKYHFETVSSVSRETPLPGVEITGKSISGDQLNLNAVVYDALSDVAETGDMASLKLWVNSREKELSAGDKPGVFRLPDYAYKLFPGRNEVTIVAENGLGGRGSETIVIEGSGQGGYQFVGDPARNPERPTYPSRISVDTDYMGLPEGTSFALSVGDHQVELDQASEHEGTAWYHFESKPFLAVAKPAPATAAMVEALPSAKPVFVTDLEDDIALTMPNDTWNEPGEWTLKQSGFELKSPKPVEVAETNSQGVELLFEARGLGEAPGFTALQQVYKGEGAIQDVSADIVSSYQSAYADLDSESKDTAFEFTVDALEIQDGYNKIDVTLGGRRFGKYHNSFSSFRFPAPTKSGVRVFSSDRKADSVLDGVTGRMGDIWYPVDPQADLAALGDALVASGCDITGMMDIKDAFDDSSLKRSFLVRGPPGRSFQAFDQLYAAQDRTTRSQTFQAEGTHGAALAGELDRVQTDEDLPASAKSALGLEIANTYQFHNGFEDLVPKTHQAYVDPGDEIEQPNSWTMRGSSLPDHFQSNPTPWNVTNTLSTATRAVSASGIIRIDSTGENTAYYATTSGTAPWSLTGARAVSLSFKLLAHDAANGPDGAFQLAVGDGTRIWTCQVAPSQVNVQGSAIVLPSAKFPSGLIDGKFHSLQFNFSGTSNDVIVSIDGEMLAPSAASQAGTFDGIAFGDPGPGLAGKFEVETLAFENSDLKYQYGRYDADDYADSDEIDQVNNILIYLRSKGQEFRTSAIARWVKILDPRVYEWLLKTYTGKSDDGLQQELTILTDNDVWLGTTVDVSQEDEYDSYWPWAKKTKVTNTLALDKEETKIWSSDQTRNEMQLAGILMAWVYEQDDYKVWLAEEEDGGTGIDGILIEKKHLAENIVKCAKRVETTIAAGAEIAISMTNEYADYAITINSMRQGDYMAMVGFIPLLPSSTARVFKFIKKGDGAAIEAIHQLSTKLDDFPENAGQWWDAGFQGWRHPDFKKIFANVDDAEAVTRARQLTSDALIPNSAWKGKTLLSTFSNSNVTIFETTQPIKAYRCFSSNPAISEYGASGGFLMFEKPIHRTQVEIDYALGNATESFLLKNLDGSSAYDRYVEVEIPAGVHVYLGIAADQGGKFKGGGTQFWVDNVTRDAINWDVPYQELPQY